MDTQTYTEEEFKKVLKTLFAEKKRVKALQKQLEEKGFQKKFQTKLSDIHKLSIAEEYATLKTAYSEKETLCQELTGKLERVRPALKKLVEDLKAARLEIDTLKNQHSHDESLEETRAHLEDEKERVEKEKGWLEEQKAQLLEEKREEAITREQFLELEEELSNEKQVRQALEEEKKAFGLSLEEWKQALAEKQEQLEHAKAHEQKEVQRFETERSRLVERLAEGLSQIQRQTEVIHDLRKENSALHREYEKLKEYEKQILELKEKQKTFLAVSEENTILKERLAKADEERKQKQQMLTFQIQECDQLTKQLEEMQAQLQESDLASVREEYEAKLADAQKAMDEMAAAHEAILQNQDKEMKDSIQELQACIAKMEVEREEKESLLEKAYTKMRELTSRHAQMVEEKEENTQLISRLEKEYQAAKNSYKAREEDIRKAQQHLAKKVKETTLLRDLTEQQKREIDELKTGLHMQKNELERMQNSLNLQQMHEEKLQLMAKERTQAAEALAKEWQEKYLVLQQECQENKAQLQELQKMRDNYDQMVATVSSLKNILGKGEES